MSLDLFRQDLEERLSSFGGTKEIEASLFDGFIRGTAQYTMRGFAKTARAIDMAGGVFPVIQDAISGGTEARDQYFKEHDQVFGSAVDYWTPKPLEVGAAAEVVGTLVSQLPIIIANPHLAVGAQVLDTAEELTAKGVEPGKAVAAGVAQGAGLAAGIWMPVLGRNLAERILVGGLAGNVTQGVVTRGATQLILEGTPGEKDFQAFDPKAMTLDALLGAMFGTLVHVSPAQRAQGAEAWTRIQRWAEQATPSERAAVATLRTAQHLNEDSLPGKADAPADVEAHVQRTRAAIDQLAADKKVQVEDLPAAKVEPEEGRFTAAARRAEQMKKEGEALAKAYDIVLEQPIGPVNDPVVRLTPEEIGDVLVERGPAFQKQGSAEIKVGGFGLVKFIWKHGERSKEPAGFQVQKTDVVRTPEVIRDYKPIEDRVQEDGKRLLEWQVEREDGKRVVYSVRRFSEGDQQQHLVTIFVNKMDKASFKEKPLSEKANRPSESPTVGSMPSVRDTGQQPLVSAAGGQEGGSEQSVKTKGPAGQPSGAEPPPPRGSEAGKPAGPADGKLDLLAAEASRIATEQPELSIRIGTDPEGNPITKSAKEFLAEADAAATALEGEQDLIRAAATCLLGKA